MKRIIVTTPTQRKFARTIPMFHCQSNHASQYEGDELMSAAEENQIYYKLAKEFIESRLDGDLTKCRVKHLAKILQEIDENMCYCHRCVVS